MCVMLADSGLLKSLWAEAYNTVTYVQNRMLTSALDSRMPYNHQQIIFLLKVAKVKFLSQRTLECSRVKIGFPECPRVKIISQSAPELKLFSKVKIIL